MSVETKDNDKKFRTLLKELKKIDAQPFVKTGFLKDEAHPDGESQNGGGLLVIASSQEFGTEHIPERPFMRITADSIRGQVGKMIDDGYTRIINGSETVEKLLGKIGVFAVGKIQETITNLSDPPNDPKTIERKGSSNPLIDTGFMRSSVRHEIVMNGKLKK